MTERLQDRFRGDDEQREPKRELSRRDKVAIVGICALAFVGVYFLDKKEGTPHIQTPTHAKDLGEIVVGKEHGRGFLVRAEDQDTIVCERQQKPDGIIDLLNGKVVVICGNASEATPVESAPVGPTE